MDLTLKLVLEIIRRLFSKKVKTGTQSFIFLQVLEKPVLPQLQCITIFPTLKRKKLFFLPTQCSSSNNKQMLLKKHFMESLKISLFVKNLTKNMEEIKFILIGLGTESTEKQFAFMDKKIKKLDKQKRKKFKAVSCQKNNFFENLKILQ